MHNNIPLELRKLNQWVCFDIEGDRKIPYIAGSNSQAASNKPKDWRSYRLALADVESGKRDHIGFCFSSSDPYVFIDLDDLEDPDQRAVFERLQTYAQYSVSGEGVHLIAKGTFDGDGKHPATPDAGIFKERRFCLMTGNIVRNRNKICEVPADDLQAVHSWLGGGKGEELSELVEYEADIDDQELLDAGNERFTKFEALCCGEWQQFPEYANDHSAADHAFLAMLCDLTKSNEQVRSVFHSSGMWNEERAAKKSGHGFAGYVNRTIKKIRSKQDREADLCNAITLDFGPEPVKVLPPLTPKVAAKLRKTGATDLIESLPEGLVKEVAWYSYRTSFYPLQEASILVALMLISGICGRGWLTPTKSGLNLWMVLVGGTSCGKDEYQVGLKRLIAPIARTLPNIRKIFGGEIVSGPGVETVFQDTFRFISYIPEFGDTFKSLANPNAPDYVRSLTRALLNSFNSAGKNGSSEGRKKAQKSDEKVFIERPCLCLAGEATPESLYGHMTSRELSTGFLQRFILLDVPQTSWSCDENPNYAAAPPPELVAKLERLALAMDSLDAKGSRFSVVKQSKQAGEMLKAYRDGKRREIMGCEEGLAMKEIINRAGLKTLRIASLLAIGSDFDDPMIRTEHATWAIKFVEGTDGAMLARFAVGDIGGGQVKQELEILKVAKSLSKLTPEERRKLGMNEAVAKECKMIPYSLLKARCVNSATFANDKAGAITAFDRCINNMDLSGTIVKLKADYAWDSFKVSHGTLLCLRGK